MLKRLIDRLLWKRAPSVTLADCTFDSSSSGRSIFVDLSRSPTLLGRLFGKV